MWSADAVVVCALTLLGRSAASLPPIQFVDTPPPGVSRNAEAFVVRGEPTIFLVTSAPMFQRARNAGERCGDRTALVRVASDIVHEDAHVRGADEASAYAAQLLTLTALGEGPGHPEYTGVWLSRRAALKHPREVGDRIDVLAGGPR